MKSFILFIGIYLTIIILFNVVNVLFINRYINKKLNEEIETEKNNHNDYNDILLDD